ncbi:MAG: acetylhydrolase [Alphaproteobacteria bacterium]|nr:acetylhydrolase [Alphaproteobacteria bacterium]
MRRMRRRDLLHAMLAAPALLLGGRAAHAVGPYGAPGRFRASEIRDTWHDPARAGRAMPVLLRLPEPAAGRVPLVLVSHGLGGSREGLGYLGRHLAGNGFAVLHLQHPGSDKGIWRDADAGGEGRAGGACLRALRRAFADPEAAIARFGDVPFALDEIARRAAADPVLRGRIDLGRAGIAGHSYGARTVLSAAGQGFAAPAAALPPGRFAEPRLKAGIALSPAPPAREEGAAFARILFPLLHIFGTEDRLALPGQNEPMRRRVPFDRIGTVEQYLLVVQGANHMVFGGEGRWGQRDARHVHPRVQAVGHAFLRAHLLEDRAAAAWLAGPGVRGSLGPRDLWEVKRAPPG